MSNNSSISCSCGNCELVLNERRAKFAFLCACEDCHQALLWGASKGSATKEVTSRHVTTTGHSPLLGSHRDGIRLRGVCNISS